MYKNSLTTVSNIIFDLFIHNINNIIYTLTIKYNLIDFSHLFSFITESMYYHLNNRLNCSFKLKYELIQIQKIILNQFLNLRHFKLHPLLIIIDQIWAQQQCLCIQQLDIINFILLYYQMSLLLYLIHWKLTYYTRRR